MAATLSRGWAQRSGLVAFLLLPAICWAHGETPPKPPPPTYPPSAVIDWVAPQRWSWLHWWEANRDPYLESIRQGRLQRPDPQVVARCHAQAVEALLEALDGDLPQVRASAATALGRMAELSACQRLIKLAVDDTDESVRRAGLVAIGLLDCPEGETFLLSHKLQTLPEREAALVAIGLSRKPTPAVTTGLQAALDASAIGRGTIAAWALRRRTDPANAMLLTGLVTKNPSLWLVSEGVLSLGAQGGAESLQPLANILLKTPAGQNYAYHRALSQAHIERLEVASGGRVRAELFVLWKTSPNRNPPSPRQRSRNGNPLVGFEPVYLARLRASAAIALGQINHAASRRVLLESLAGPDNAYNDLHKGFAIMSLGLVGDDRCLPALLKILSPLVSKLVRKPPDEQSSPLRGYAALALGLYARPTQTPQGPTNRPQFDKVCEALAQRMADRSETTEVRAAAALGLGLTGRTENLRHLQQASRSVGPKDDLLMGYTLLGRGMLADNNIIEPAMKYLSLAEDRDDVSGILGRRAAVLGLGLLGNRQGIPILRAAWDLSYYVNREVALAYSLCEAYDVTGPLVRLLKTGAKPLERGFAARCLGELLAPSRPQRLALLINGSNYTLRNDKTASYCTLANEFLYNYLIAAWGDNWQ